VLRFTSSGVLDSSFGNAGFAHGGVFTLGGPTAGGIALQPDGKIIVVGYCQQTAAYVF
jgi:hypothetical protein